KYLLISRAKIRTHPARRVTKRQDQWLSAALLCAIRRLHRTSRIRKLSDGSTACVAMVGRSTLDTPHEQARRLQVQGKERLLRDQGSSVTGSAATLLHRQNVQGTERKADEAVELAE